MALDETLPTWARLHPDAPGSCGIAGLLGFALSHLLGLVIGAWPAVLLVAVATAGLCWRLSDSRRAPGLSGRAAAG